MIGQHKIEAESGSDTEHDEVRRGLQDLHGSGEYVRTSERDQVTGSPHPGAPEFAKAYSQAWTSDLPRLLSFFAVDGSYTDVAMGTTYEGHDGISRFHRFMLKFAPDSLIEFDDGHVADSRLYLEWVWSGTFAGPLRLRSGKLIDASGVRFSVPGLAACEYGEDGLLTRHRDFWDLATVLDQAAVPIG